MALLPGALSVLWNASPEIFKFPPPSSLLPSLSPITACTRITGKMSSLPVETMFKKQESAISEVRGLHPDSHPLTRKKHQDDAWEGTQ